MYVMFVKAIRVETFESLISVRCSPSMGSTKNQWSALYPIDLWRALILSMSAEPRYLMKQTRHRIGTSTS